MLLGLVLLFRQEKKSRQMKKDQCEDLNLANKNSINTIYYKSKNADSVTSNNTQTKLVSLKSCNKSTNNDSPKTKLKKLFGSNKHFAAAPNSISNFNTFAEYKGIVVKDDESDFSCGTNEMKLDFHSKGKS